MEQAGRRKILVVDDNRNDRVLLRDLLASRNYEVRDAGNGAEALSSIEELKPDIIISDIMMPGMDGFTLLRELKKIGCYEDIPFVFYTAQYVSGRDRELATNLGASRFIIKPVNLNELLGEIEAVLREYEAGLVKPVHPRIDKEEDYLRLYNERIVLKLEEKIVQLEQEINERRWAFEELAKAQNELDHIAENIPFIIYALNMDGKLVRWNRGLTEATGTIGNKVMGRSILDFISENDRTKMADAIKTAEKTGHSRVDALLIGKNGGKVKYRWNSAVLRDDDGRVIGLSGVGIKIRG